MVPGPSTIEESFTTIVVYPGWEAGLDEAGDYVLTRVGERGSTDFRPTRSPSSILPGRRVEY